MAILQIKQAQRALGDGRLEEAFGILQADEVRRHRQGQELVTKLARAFVQRGANHMEAGRLIQAASDCDKAGRLAGNATDVAKLRASLASRAAGKGDDDRARASLLAEARGHIDRGYLTVGEGLLDHVQGDADADRLRRQVGNRRNAAKSAEQKLQGALAGEQWFEAIDELVRAQADALADRDLARLISLAAGPLAGSIRGMIDAGRLDLAETLLQRLRPITERSHQFQELAGIMNQCILGRRWIQTGQARRAAEVFDRLQILLPGARWLAKATSNCQAAAEALEAVRRGPVGLLDPRSSAPDGLDSASYTQPAEAPATVKNSERATGTPPSAERPARTILPDRFVIRADGVGSFLVVRSRTVTIGPVSSSRRPDVGLVIDPAMPVAEIERVDDDYFLRCERPVSVNGQATNEALLADGDRISLSPRVRLKFVRPNAASGSAVLAVTSGRLAQVDIRRVILMGREILLGPGPRTHMRVDELDDMATLCARDNMLFCKSREAVAADGRALGASQPLLLDVPVRIGPVRLTISAV